MKKKPETKIVEQISRYIRAKGGDCYHVHGSLFQRQGEPDLDGWLPNGIHLKVEVKTPTGKPSELQLHRLRVYHKAGYVAGVVTSVEAFMKLLKDYERFGKGQADVYNIYD